MNIGYFFRGIAVIAGLAVLGLIGFTAYVAATDKLADWQKGKKTWQLDGSFTVTIPADWEIGYYDATTGRTVAFNATDEGDPSRNYSIVLNSASTTTQAEFESWKQEQFAFSPEEVEYAACESRSDWGSEFECFRPVDVVPGYPNYFSWINDQAVQVIWGGGSENEVQLNFAPTPEELKSARKIPVLKIPKNSLYL